MKNNEKIKRMLVADLLSNYESIHELSEEIINLSKNKTAADYLLLGIADEYETFFELLAELKTYGVDNYEQALFYFLDTKK